MTNNCEFHVLLLIFWNMKFVTGYGWKQIIWSNLTLQTIASYNVSNVVLVFSMLSLGRILISNLVVANLLMYSLSGMILLYLATAFLHWMCFWMRLLLQNNSFQFMLQKKIRILRCNIRSFHFPKHILWTAQHWMVQ